LLQGCAKGYTRQLRRELEAAWYYAWYVRVVTFVSNFPARGLELERVVRYVIGIGKDFNSVAFGVRKGKALDCH
jgi:hypothetical protein